MVVRNEEALLSNQIAIFLRTFRNQEVFGPLDSATHGIQHFVGDPVSVIGRFPQLPNGCFRFVRLDIVFFFVVQVRFFVIVQNRILIHGQVLGF